MHISKYNLIGFFIVLGTFTGLLPVYAFTVSPGAQVIVVKAGEIHSGDYIVGNRGEEAIRIGVTADDQSVAQQLLGRQTVKEDGSSPNWLDFEPRQLELGPFESGSINYTITLPKDAEGEYSAILYFTNLPASEGKGISMSTRIGNTLYAIAEGTEVVKGELVDIAVTRTDPMNIRVTIENSGNIHIRPKGDITIRKKGLFLSAEEKEPVIIPFNKPGFPVLPKRNNIFEARSKDVKFGLGWYSLEFEAEFDGKKLEKQLKFKIERGGGVKTFPADK